MAVYAVLQQSNHDLTSAESFGHLEILFPLGINIFDADVISEAAKRWFADFDFDEDYFLPVGNPVVVAVVSMCLMEEAIATVGSGAVINLLEWDNKSRAYVPHEMVLENWEEE